MKVVIMAGGKGTRIASVKSDVPKPMIEIGGKPILEHQIDNLRKCGLTDITLVIGYLGHVIKDYFGDGSRFGVNINYFIEDHPLGTAGALFKMYQIENGKFFHLKEEASKARRKIENSVPRIDDDFLLLCGDVMLDMDFSRFIQFHKEHGAWASLTAHPNGHPFDSSLLVTEILPPQEKGGMPVETQRVLQWLNKEDERTYYRNCVNAGIEIISPRLLEEVRLHHVPRHPETPDKIDLDRDVLKPYISSGKIFAYHTPEYIKDMGTPERFYETEKDLENAKPSKRNLKNKQKAIFIDRDGTMNVKKGFLNKVEDFELIEGVAEAIHDINLSDYLAIVVTNQPQIARGDCTFEELQLIHNKMETDLGLHGAFVDGIYFCPHHTDKGFPGERIEYKCNCDCRKPNPGMLLKAAKDFNIDLSQSYMIGDSANDVKAGDAAGCCKSYLIDGNSPNALLETVTTILNK